MSRGEAQRLDRQDELASFRQQFVREDPDLIYLLGNSLGRLPRPTVAQMRDVVEQQWGQRLIRGWLDGWMALPQRVGDKIGRLLGAREGEVIVAESTSINLYKVILAALEQRPDRRKVLSDDLNFPSDLYVWQGALRTLGGDHELQLLSSPDGVHGPVQALAEAIDEETALIILSHTLFESGFVYDMAAITRLAHKAGALIVWDLSHSAGAVPVDLGAAGADYAVGCTYKYLNGGPGAPAFLYVRRDLQAGSHNPISGWMGQDRPFEFELTYRPAPDLRRFLTGTPTVLSLAAIEPGVDLLLQAGMARVQQKARRQTAYLIQLWEAYLQPLGVDLQSPPDAAQRGAHVALAHPEGLRISLALKEQMNVLLDFRRPDVLRLSCAPLYTSYVELFDAVHRLRTVVTERLYEAHPHGPPPVT
ncbi:MAG TPA: kynureninase [Candidatus Sulfomarinibacteraceae bacterium]|nr:kynureninase [Candidatus Sulfomarinibacteraceae bacterium]